MFAEGSAFDLMRELHLLRLSPLEEAVREAIWDALLVPGELYVITYGTGEWEAERGGGVRFLRKDGGAWHFYGSDTIPANARAESEFNLSVDCSCAWGIEKAE